MTIPPVVASPRGATTGAAATVRRVLSGIWTTFLVIVSILMVMSAGGSYGAEDGSFVEPYRSIANVGTFVMIAASFILIWRHRHPVLSTAVLAGLTLVLPTSILPALIAVAAAVAADLSKRTRWILVAAVWVASTVGVWWNLQSGFSAVATLAGNPAIGSSGRTALMWFAPIFAAICLLPFVGFALIRNATRARDIAEQGTAAATRNVAVLHREVERERDRQHLARELHDTLAARLSTVSLHAGALELTVDETDPRAAMAARRVREAAQGSLDDLRGIVDVLKNPAEAGPVASIDDLSALIDEQNRQGADVRAQIFVTGTSGCDPEVSHAMYRLIQESISNARRHAPSKPIRIDLRGGPEAGLSLQALNWQQPGVIPASRGGGHGLQGMYERVALLGGTFQAGPTPDGGFAVVAWLPWARR